MNWLRRFSDRNPVTTAINRRPSRWQLAVTQKPASLVYPVFSPSTPGHVITSLLWLRSSVGCFALGRNVYCGMADHSTAFSCLRSSFPR